MNSHDVAFPSHLIERYDEIQTSATEFVGGMTMREHFASLAMQSILSNQKLLLATLRSGDQTITGGESIAREAVSMADSLILVLNQSS